MTVRWKIFTYLAIFSALILAFLWLFQIVFLEDFYKAIKTKTIYWTADMVQKQILSESHTDEEIKEYLEDFSRQQEICIRLFDDSGTEIASADVLFDCVIHKMSPAKQVTLYLEAVQNGGEYLERFTKEKFENKEEDYAAAPIPLPPPRGIAESIVYTRIFANAAGESYVLMLNATISPVNATVQTLQIQLICVSVILLLLAMVLSAVISRKLAKPIAAISASAEQLTAGNYQVTFTGDGYREIARLNQTLNIAARELEKTESLRKELLANVSHDLRTPLTMITGYAEVMRDLPGENTPENLQIIIDESKRLTALVNDMLDLSKLESGAVALHKERFNLTLALQEMLSRYRKLIEQEGYTIHFEPDTEVWVCADALKISQVLYNLLNNAVHYTGPDRQIFVRQLVQGDMVRIEVEDTGKGLEKEELTRVWDRYYKVDKSLRRLEFGSGLGLSIVKSIIDLHDGQYGVESQKGSGSVFWFSLKRETDETSARLV